MKIDISNDGMKLEKIETIFDAFEKGTNGNSGLGLYITRRIVELYGGNIVANNTNDGVTFTINIPIELVKSESK
jgi:two-component system sensor histidine kinase CssS